MNKTILGWDIGGAHLKAVLLDDTGQAVKVWQVACPLWQGLDKLTAAVEGIYDALDVVPSFHAITMTGELADIFSDRAAGVLQISQLMSDRFENAHFYAGRAGFVSSENVSTRSMQIASANWFASAEFVANVVRDGLFIDIGSTTCAVSRLRACIRALPSCRISPGCRPASWLHNR